MLIANNSEEVWNLTTTERYTNQAQCQRDNLRNTVATFTTMPCHGVSPALYLPSTCTTNNDNFVAG